MSPHLKSELSHYAFLIFMGSSTFVIILASVYVVYLAMTDVPPPCPEGQYCPLHWICCDTGCCPPLTLPPRKEGGEALTPNQATIRQVMYIWITLGSIMLCCFWCLFIKVYCSFACCVRRASSNPDSAGSVYPPPRYSRCGSFHQAPPPYSEVTSKPDLYPLVITCGDGDGKTGGNYLMVKYFRNYAIRPPGSLSATSTAESLSSSYMCNAANEANSIIPPPYSCEVEVGGSTGSASGRIPRSISLSERRELAPTFRDNLISSPVQPLQNPSIDLELEMIDCELYCNGVCKPRLGPSPPVHRSPRRAELYSPDLQHLFPNEPVCSCESPPQPTSPTESRDSTLRRQLRMSRKARKASLYMPLSLAQPRPRPAPVARSAPATPCASLMPSLLSFSQRVSSRAERFDEESDPLLHDSDLTRPDHKF